MFSAQNHTVAEPQPFDADPDPTFYIDEDMNPNFTKLVKHKKLNSNFLSFHFNSF